LTFHPRCAYHSPMRVWLCVLWVLLCVPAGAAPLRVRDARGVVVVLPSPPQRIISLAPGTTEALFALGLGKRIVGDTTYCTFPPAAKAVAKIGDVRVNYEAVIALRPDLVVASDANRASAPRLTSLGLRVFVIAPTSYEGVAASVRLLGQVTGTQAQAARIASHMEQVRQIAITRAARDKKRPAVLAVLGLNPLFVAGRGTFIGDLIGDAGGINSAAGVNGYAAFSKEQLLAHPPDYILADARAQTALRADPTLRDLGAVRAGHWINMDPDVLNRPGPRLADALEELSRTLHPALAKP